MTFLKKNLLIPALAAAVLTLGLACEQQQKPVVLEHFKYVNEEAVPRISVEDAKKEFDAGNAVFVDSRGDGAYNAEHLPGALNIPFGATPDKFTKLPKGKKIIVYCS
ncbi:MAG: rhodanese-like domain-containing protein [Pyrinomonadaceae bacterium]